MSSLTTWVAMGVAGAVYLLARAATDFLYGEAPGSLGRDADRLQGREPERRNLLEWLTRSQMPRRQRITLTAAASAVLFVGGLVFFRSLWMALLTALAAPLYPVTVERALQNKRRELLTVQFGLALQAMAASLRAGASLRTAVERAAPDLRRMLAGQPLTPMVDELERVARDLQMGFSLDEALIRFRDRVDLEDVRDFVGAILITRVRGGNAAEIVARIAEIIQDKIQVRQQILTLTAGKRAEGRLFTFGPPIMVTALAITSPTYMAPLYEEPLGQFLLFIGAAMLAAAYFISRRLLEIDV